MLLITDNGNRVRVSRKNAPTFLTVDVFYSLATVQIWKLLLLVVLIHVGLVAALFALAASAPPLCDLGKITAVDEKFIQACKGVFFGGVGDSKEVGCAGFNFGLTWLKTLLNTVIGMALYARLATGRKRYHTIKASDELHARFSNGVLSIEALFADMRGSQMVGVNVQAFFIDKIMRITPLVLQVTGSLLTGLRITHIVDKQSPIHSQVPEVDVIDHLNSNFQGQIVIVVSGEDARSGPSEFRRAYNSFTAFPINNPWSSDHLGVCIDYSAI